MHGKLKINNSPHEIVDAAISWSKSKTANRFAGFTLTEVVIASALLIIAMVPILKGLTSANLGTVII